jgi:hypothetical protein
VAELPVRFVPGLGAGVWRDHETVTVLRSVLMKPEHLDWIERIWEILAEVAEWEMGEPTGPARAGAGQ